MVLTCTHNLCFEQKYKNSKKNSAENYNFNSQEISKYIAWACFRYGSSLFSVCTVYPDISVRKLRIITVLEQSVIGQPKWQLVNNGKNRVKG